MPDTKNPQAWNRYAYTVNNPLKYKDPSGHCFLVCGLIGAAVGLIAYTANAVINQTGWNVGDAALSTGAGFAVGATLGVAAPVVLGAAAETMAGVSVATGSGTLALAATNTYAAASAVAATDAVAIAAVSNRLSGSNLALPAPATADPLALPAPTYQNPRTGEIVSAVSEQDSTFYQVASTPDAIGRSKWLSVTRPASSSDAISGLALPPGNTAAYISEVTVPAGVRFQTSTASRLFGQPGGWLQAELLERSPLVKFGPPQPLPRALLERPQ